MNRLCRRSLTTLSLAWLAALGTGVSGLVQAQEEDKVLNIYNWSDYIAEDTIRTFEKETGIKVRYDNFDNNEIVHAKLVAGKSGYDIVVPSSNWAKLQIDGGLLAKIDKSKIANYKNLDPAVQAQLARMDPGNEYMVNWLWGFTTVGINVDKVKAALGGMPMPDNAWDLVFKPEYISKMKGCGVAFLDSASEVVPAALHYLGKPSFSKLPTDYDPTDRIAAMNQLQVHHAKGEIVTGLLFVDPESKDLHDHLGTIKTPLNRLGDDELTPSAAALAAITETLR